MNFKPSKNLMNLFTAVLVGVADDDGVDCVRFDAVFRDADLDNFRFDDAATRCGLLLMLLLELLN